LFEVAEGWLPFQREMKAAHGKHGNFLQAGELSIHKSRKRDTRLTVVVW